MTETVLLTLYTMLREYAVGTVFMLLNIGRHVRLDEMKKSVFVLESGYCVFYRVYSDANCPQEVF